ncbi:MAG: hypothetical protein EJNHJLOP_00004 [Methanophagales virus PBV082]|uniref:Uncharacterized protein n=1 Tax=Methanophagales virus PBV082 TaxID=3071307 RepID=A0AA46YIS3_9VIRU|nr:MAG: hypothetical protein QIT52_gp04 [Methanophagales virus PBV082]UYL64893.1 MAG: hypothetical protein EJNHJLOP_00004 [Methanophagales virus PBV082]
MPKKRKSSKSVKKKAVKRKRSVRSKIVTKRCPHCGFRIQGSELEVFFTTICPSCWQPLPPDREGKE